MNNLEKITQLIHTLAVNPLDQIAVDELFLLYKREGLIKESHARLYDKLEIALQFIKERITNHCDYILFPPNYILFYYPNSQAVRKESHLIDDTGVSFSMTHIDTIKTELTGREKKMINFSHCLYIPDEFTEFEKLKNLGVRSMLIKNRSITSFEQIDSEVRNLVIKGCRNLQLDTIQKLVGYKLINLSFRTDDIKDCTSLEPIVEYIIQNQESLRNNGVFDYNHNDIIHMELSIGIDNSNISIEPLLRLLNLPLRTKIFISLKNRIRIEAQKRIAEIIKSFNKTSHFFHIWYPK